MSVTFFIQRLHTFLLYILDVFYVFNVFFNFHLNVYYIYMPGLTLGCVASQWYVSAVAAVGSWLIRLARSNPDVPNV